MDKKLFVAGLSVLILIGVVALGAVYFSRSAEIRGTAYGQPYPLAADFVLSRVDGTQFQLSEVRGKIVLLFFGYTACPDVCPTTLAELNLALSELGPEQAQEVQVVFVTVDPARDDPARVQAYVDNFNSSFIGLSGTEPELAKVWNDYGIYREIAEESSATGYVVNHTARVTLIDRQGNLRVSFGFDTPVDDILHDVKLILKEN